MWQIGKGREEGKMVTGLCQPLPAQDDAEVEVTAMSWHQGRVNVNSDACTTARLIYISKVYVDHAWKIAFIKIELSLAYF